VHATLAERVPATVPIAGLGHEPAAPRRRVAEPEVETVEVGR
jgi:hypothetical protein